MSLLKGSRRSLLISRLIIALLLVLAALLWRNNTQLEEKLSFLEKHAFSLYPFAPYVDRNFDFTIDYFGLKYFGNYEEDWPTLYTGAAEKPELYFLKDAMQRTAPQDGVFVDVGANKGGHSLFMSLHSKEVIAYEPYPPVLREFQRMVNENNVKNITVRDVGLGAQEDTATFYIAPDSITTGSFKQGFNKNEKKAGEFKIVVGDKDLAALGVSRTHLIKIDVEGYEKYVLSGLRETLERDRPIVLAELLSFSKQHNSFQDPTDFKDAFPERYKFYQFDEYNLYTGSYKLAPADLKKRNRTKSHGLEIKPRNVVAIPIELESKIFP